MLASLQGKFVNYNDTCPITHLKDKCVSFIRDKKYLPYLRCGECVDAWVIAPSELEDNIREYQERYYPTINVYFSDYPEEVVNMTIKNKDIYKGRVIKQVEGVMKVFDWFFSIEKFDYIIEIGTGSGAFTIFLAEHAKKMGAIFNTYDLKKIKNKKIINELKELNVNLFTGDINKNKEVEEILKKNFRCLILNDGGLKVPQFRRFGKLLKKNDIILTHDYYKNLETSASGIIVMKDIKKMTIKNNLKIIYEKYFDDYLWLCAKKVKNE